MQKVSPAAEPSPSDLRRMLGANLRHLSRDAPSIAALCRDLGINRTQFNRYLSGESFPRPDVLHRICRFFGVDARILLEPVDHIRPSVSDLLRHAEVAEFVGAGSKQIPQSVFPDGIYRFSRPSFLQRDRYVQGLVLVYRRDGHTFIRGMEARDAMRQQGLAGARAREFRGFVLPQEGGVAALIARRGAMTFSFNFLAPMPSFDNNFWVGYAARTVREDSASGRRIARMVYEHLGAKRSEILASARRAGLCGEADLIPYHRTLLRPQDPFV